MGRRHDVDKPQITQTVQAIPPCLLCAMKLSWPQDLFPHLWPLRVKLSHNTKLSSLTKVKKNLSLYSSSWKTWKALVLNSFCWGQGHHFESCKLENVETWQIYPVIVGTDVSREAVAVGEGLILWSALE